MDVAVFALFRTKTPKLRTLRKQTSCLKLPSSLPSSHREQPEFEELDPHVVSSYVKMKAEVLNEQQDGIQRSPSEASLFFHYTSPESFQKPPCASARSVLPPVQRRSLKSSIRRGLMMIPGNIVLMRAAQSGRQHQIGFGVKASVGQRPLMEDSHIVEPFFFRFPISLACARQLIPDFVQTELEKNSMTAKITVTATATAAKTDSQPARHGLWNPSGEGNQSPGDDGVHCVFDEFDLFLVCDGHGGAQVSQYCTANFNKILKRQLKNSVEERYLELLQSAQKSKPGAGAAAISSVSTEDFGGFGGLRRTKSASNLAEGRPHVASEDFERSKRKLKGCESLRVRKSGQLDAELRSRTSLTSRPTAQCGLDVHHLRDCLTQSFLQLDAEIKERKLGDFEGSTALAALVGSWHVCVANCGDSRAVLSRNAVAVRLTRDHKPYIEEERLRIEDQGGFVLNAYGCSRVNGFLAMSRAIGDHLIPSVIAKPDVTILRRHHQDEFLILATDGLWDVMTDQEACDMTRKCLARADAKGARKLSTRVAANVLLKAALDKGSTDNITIAVVDLRMSQEQKGIEKMS